MSENPRRTRPGLAGLAGSGAVPRGGALRASPFRFLFIDDPVQAMDPAKVDGLARVLESTAAGQTIVFTHDYRREYPGWRSRSVVLCRDYPRGDPDEHPFEPIGWPG